MVRPGSEDSPRLLRYYSRDVMGVLASGIDFAEHARCGRGQTIISMGGNPACGGGELPSRGCPGHLPEGNAPRLPAFEVYGPRTLAGRLAGIEALAGRPAAVGSGR